MDSSQTQPQPENRLHFLDYWRIIRIRKAIIITVFLITAIVATAVTFLLPESYASTARIKIEPNIVTDIPGVTGTMTMSPYDPYFIQTEFEIIQDRVVLGKVIENLNLNVEWGKKYYGGETLKTPETMEFLKRRMSLIPVRNTKLIEITVYSEDRNDAARIANAIAETYKTYRLKQREQLTLNGIKALEDQFKSEEERIQSAQTNVDNLRKELGINDTDPNSINPSPTLTQEQLRNYNAMRLEGETRYMKLEKQLTQLKVLDRQKLRDVLPTVIPDTALSDLLNKLHESQQTYVTLTNDYAPADLHITRVQSMIDELNRQVDDRVAGIMAALENQVQSEKAALDALTASLEQAKTNDQAESIRGQPYWEAKRRLANMIDFNKLLAAKIEATKLDLRIPQSSIVEITGQAEPGETPVKPNKTLNIILGVIIGLIMGVGLAFFIEYLDTSVKTIDEVERAFQAPVLGVIPQNVGYLVDEGPESPHAEAYRVLRTNILFSRKDEKLNTIVVVSAGAGEGKSITTVNLATVFAQAGQRVLVVDSDLRRPTLHKVLRVSNNLGLTNYLLKQNKLEEVIQPTAVAMLDFMASGKLPSTSMSILGSAQMKEMVAELKQRYDFIFFDSPPVLGVSDASVLASEVDMVIQVIQYRRYPQPMSIRAKQLIEKVGGNLIGILLNNINMSQDESYYYYTGYYHGGYYYTRTEDAEPVDKPKAGEDVDIVDIKQKY
ncbi:MAG TPA: polysaccharide biosynthesis tyrosine autokinase [Candidatus Acidoferrum sp.]|nr:polysaccharide biosynthesis tyrosine autokinase [Candidatus Acidoferrum sp.]